MQVDFVEQGRGPALLFLPGSYSTHAAWTGVLNALRGSYRTIATSLPGYGGSAEVRPDDVAGMAAMTGFVADLIRRIGEPVHLVGHSFGGLVALAAALSDRITPLSVITFEANPVFSRRDGPDFGWKPAVHALHRDFARALDAGDPDAAGLIIDYWSGPGTFRSLSDPVRAFCRENARSNLLDWACAVQFTPHMRDYAAIGVPVTLVRGEHANDAITDITAEISRHIPGAAHHVVPGADHGLITTHAAACAALIDDHMARAAG